MTRGIQCSICSGAPEILQAVNRAIHKKENLRELCRELGLSKSSVYRHRQHVTTDTLRTLANPTVRGFAIQTADGNYYHAFTDPPRPMSAADLAKIEYVVRIRYPAGTDQRTITREEALQIKASMEAKSKPPEPDSGNP